MIAPLVVFLIFVAFSFYKTHFTIDNNFDKQWPLNQEHLNILSLSKQYEKCSKKECIVAIIDTGIDCKHEDLQGSLWINENEIDDGIDNDHNGYVDDFHGWNFYDDSNDISRINTSIYDNDHGTAIVGIINATWNRIGIHGVCDNRYVKIMNLKVLGNITGRAKNTEDIIDAIHYAENNGAAICNMSINMDQFYPELKEAMQVSDMLFVVSAGNRIGLQRNLEQTPSYPASFKLNNVIVVSALNENGRLNNNSNYGKGTVDIAAPGKNIFSTISNNAYDYMTGTSFAVPYVTAGAAIVKTVYPNMSSEKVKQYILKHSDSHTRLKKYIANGAVLTYNFNLLKGD